MPNFEGSVTVSPTGSPNPQTIKLTGNSGDMEARNALLENVVSARVGSFSPPGVVATIELDGGGGIARLGREGQSGTLLVQDQGGNDTAVLDGQDAAFTLGTRGKDGKITLQDSDGDPTVRVSAHGASLTLGAKDHSAVFDMKDRKGEYTVALEADDATLRLGSNGKDGQVRIFNGDGDETLHFDGNNGSIELGGRTQDGDLVLTDAAGKRCIRLNGSDASLVLGLPGGPNGRVLIRHPDGGHVLKVGTGDASALPAALKSRNNTLLLLGNEKHAAGIAVHNDKGEEHFITWAKDIDRAAHDARREYPEGAQGFTQVRGYFAVHGKMYTGALSTDLAEAFPVEDLESSEPGSVMVIAEGGRLRHCDQALDTRAAGVVSGAGELQPGLVLGGAGRPIKIGQTDETLDVPPDDEAWQSGDEDPKVPLALAGKVYCKVDAAFGPIEPGDLLTTSETPGHAMKVSEPASAIGAIIGKALDRLRDGRGLIPILVSPQ